MDFHHHQQHDDSSSSLALPLFSSEPSSSSSTKTSKEMMMMMQGVGGGYLSVGQWQELEVQALIYRHMLTASPIPHQLLHLLLNSNSNSNSNNSSASLHPLSNFPPLYQTGGGYWGRGGIDPEPGRCRRTDGKKWRCSRDVVVGHKYCERHIHRGRNRSRKPVEIPIPTTAAGSRGGGGGGDYGGGVLNKSSSSNYATTTTSTCTNSVYGTGGAQPYAALSGGISGHSPFFDQLHHNQRSSSDQISEPDKKSSDGQTLRPFFNDWPRTVQEQEMLATSLSISLQGDARSDFSLKLSTRNDETNSRGGDRERAPSNWGTLWGTHHVGPMGGPLAEALRSSSTSNASSPTSVLHQLQRGSATTSEISYVST